ncbi:hypothetical protein NC651_001707 [Populus alba x Populus x berolinensis]|nr:hypothetical protein NC651_001707 [Populus alba x Populus x berolinensis]
MLLGNSVGRDDKSYNQGRNRKTLGRKAKKESFGFDAGNSNKSVSGRVNDGAAKPKKWSKNQNTPSEPQSSIMEFIWEELGPKFRDLLEMGKSGLIASLIAASQRHHTREHEVYYSDTISCLTFLLKF